MKLPFPWNIVDLVIRTTMGAIKYNKCVNYNQCYNVCMCGGEIHK